MKPQRFKRGDVVHIAKDLGPAMKHFDNDQDAIILGSHQDQFGGDKVDIWTVMLCDSGARSSWYHTNQLTFLRHGGEQEIQKVEALCSSRQNQERNIHWILANWSKIRLHTPDSTMEKLMELIGITNPYGFRGEELNYYFNAFCTYQMFDSVLSTGKMESLNQFLEQLGHPSAS